MSTNAHSLDSLGVAQSVRSISCNACGTQSGVSSVLVIRASFPSCGSHCKVEFPQLCLSYADFPIVVAFPLRTVAEVERVEYSHCMGMTHLVA